jgi:hypothetical protein
MRWQDYGHMAGRLNLGNLPGWATEAIGGQRTFGLGGRFYGMPDAAVAAKKTVEVGKKQILDQRLRIDRQRHLIARHERDGHPDLAADAVRMLGQMERALAEMEAHYARAQEHLAQVTVDEPSVEKVERDPPM